ncbi:unnamed protein product [Orchesella dallaii]|uniref:Haloacid dehalogenase-like hydrolase domain-containing protein 2 n=1 Tax=Orchesella dallaii TaxID=48710 RepID=A0ABP1RTM3_9HEXA
MDLPPLSVPIITQRLKEARTFWTYGFIHLPVELPLPLKLKSKDGYLQCPFSNYFHKCKANFSLECDNICSQIDFLKYTLNTKPWNCEAEILIWGDRKTYPYGPHIFNHDWIGLDHKTEERQINSISQMIPTYQPLKILVVPKTHVINGYGRTKIISPYYTPGLIPDSVTYIFESWLFHWYRSLVSVNKATIMFNLFKGSRGSMAARYSIFLFCTDPVPRSTNVNITAVYSLSILQVQQSLFSFLHYVLLSVYTKTVSSCSKEAIPRGLFVDVEMLVSGVSLYNENCTTRTCYYVPKPSSLEKWEGSTFSKTSDNLLTAYVQLWSAIFKNQTVGVTSPDKTFTICSSGWRCVSRVAQDFWKTSKLRIILGITHGFGLPGEYSPITVMNSKFSLGFVSCGLPPQSTLAFKDLVNIFDVRVWLLITIVYLLTTPIAIHLIEKKSKLIRQYAKRDGKQIRLKLLGVKETFWQSVIVLLEQGDPFRTSQIRLPSIKWVVSSLLLGGIVIKNAYKHDNVYNMIAPRKLIPYWYFNQLVEDKFQIFTRMFSGETKLTNARGFTQISPHNFTYSASFDIRDQKKVGISEIAEIVKDMTKHNISLDTRMKFSALYKHSKLHTFMMEDLSRLSVGNYDFKNSTTEDFQATESDYFYKSLEICGRTAAVLPLKLAYEHFLKLKKGGKATVYFGKEILHKRNLGFYFEGWLPEYAVSGIKGISQSGIWSRLNDIYGVSHKNLWQHSEGEINLKRPTMSGNVLVIFVVLLFGLCFSTILFFLEAIPCLKVKFLEYNLNLFSRKREPPNEDLSQSPEAKFLTNNTVQIWKPTITCFLISLNGAVCAENKRQEKVLTSRAAQAYLTLKAKEKKFKFVVNTSLKSVAQKTLASIGFRIPTSEIYSSLSSTKDYLIENYLCPHFLVADKALVEELSEFHNHFQRPNAVVVGLAPEKFNYENMNKCFRILARDKNRELIAINKSRHSVTPTGVSLGAGTFVKILESASARKAVYVGKPSKQFYLNALKSLGVTDPRTAVMIGDDVKDDVISAIEAGMHGCLVKTGKYKKGDESMMFTCSRGEKEDSLVTVPVAKRCLIVDTFADAISLLVAPVDEVVEIENV